MDRNFLTTAAATALLMAAAWQPAAGQGGARPNEAQVVAAEDAITGPALRGHIRFLADDLLEGRGPGSRGDKLAQLYLATQFQSLGLKPAAPEGGWIQRVPLVG